MNRWMDKEDMAHIYNGILLSYKKEHIWVNPNEMDEPRACYTEWRKSEKQVSYTNVYPWNPGRWYWWTFLQGRSGHRHWEQTCGHSGVRGWDDLRREHGNIYYRVWNRGPMGICCLMQGTHPRSVTTQRGEMRWEGEGGTKGRKACTATADSCWLLQQPTQYCKVIILQLKIKRKF